MAALAAMPAAYSADLRWRVVYLLTWEGLTPAEVSERLGAPHIAVKTIADIGERFYATGGVETWQGRRDAPPHNLAMTPEREVELFQLVADSPEASLNEHHAAWQTATGVRVHVSTICRALRTLGFTRKRLRHLALQRDQVAANRWFARFSLYNMRNVLFLDETSKDNRAMRRTLGYAVRGQTPRAESAFETVHGTRISALCAFSLFGFEDWRLTDGTFNTERFDDAVQQMLIDGGLIQRFPVIVLDHASIHSSQRFVTMIQNAGGIIEYTPPYCHEFTPLDNGAFGLVVRFLREHAHLVAQIGIEHALDAAFRSVSSTDAHYCFRNCGYF